MPIDETTEKWYALTRNLDEILIGRFVGPAAVGAYGRAFQLMTLPSTQLNQPLTSVMGYADLLLRKLDDDVWSKKMRKRRGEAS